MQVEATRGSVAMGDDIDAPHEQLFSFPDETPITQIVAAIVSSSYLASIAGGKATWTAVSRIPIAVVAQQWAEPRFLPQAKEGGIASLDVRDGVVCIRFNYLAQDDPETVYERIILAQWKAVA